MTDYAWPSGVRQSSADWREISNTERFPAPLSGGFQTVTRPGDRRGVSIRVANAKGRELAKLRALAGTLRGSGNRIFVPDYSYRRAGLFPSAELFSNPGFLQGTTGWTVGAGALSVADGVAKLASTQGNTNPSIYQQPTLTQYLAYVVRSIIMEGNAAGLSIGPNIVDNGSATGDDDFSTTRGYRMASIVPVNSGAAVGVYPIVFQTSTGYLAGTYARVAYASASQCLLADGGANLLQRSDDFGNAYWAANNGTHTVIVSNTAVGPDGTTTADTLRENSTSNAERYVLPVADVTVSSAGLEYAFSCAIKASARSWAALRIIESTSSHIASAWFNIATGARGSVATTGANWTNLRNYISPLGDDWYWCTLVARKVSAGTGLRPLIQATTADNGLGYVGTVSANALHMFRATLSQSSVPSRLRQSTSAAIAADSQSSSSIYVKAGRGPTQGLLADAFAIGDLVEIDGQLKVVTSPLDLNASGCGHLQLDSPFSRGVPDNTPIIVHEPLLRARLIRDPEYPIEPGVIAHFNFEFEQDLAA